jgi:hypothetical protein
MKQEIPAWVLWAVAAVLVVGLGFAIWRFTGGQQKTIHLEYNADTQPYVQPQGQPSGAPPENAPMPIGK